MRTVRLWPIGLAANNKAINCYGFSTSGGAWLHTYNAAYCTGIRPGGVAISATIAKGCIAQYGNGTISATDKYNMP